MSTLFELPQNSNLLPSNNEISVNNVPTSISNAGIVFSERILSSSASIPVEQSQSTDDSSPAPLSIVYIDLLGQQCGTPSKSMFHHIAHLLDAHVVPPERLFVFTNLGPLHHALYHQDAHTSSSSSVPVSIGSSPSTSKSTATSTATTNGNGGDIVQTIIQNASDPKVFENYRGRDQRSVRLKYLLTPVTNNDDEPDWLPEQHLRPLLEHAFIHHPELCYTRELMSHRECTDSLIRFINHQVVPQIQGTRVLVLWCSHGGYELSPENSVRDGRYSTKIIRNFTDHENALPESVTAAWLAQNIILPTARAACLHNNDSNDTNKKTITGLGSLTWIQVSCYASLIIRDLATEIGRYTSSPCLPLPTNDRVKNVGTQYTTVQPGLAPALRIALIADRPVWSRLKDATTTLGKADTIPYLTHMGPAPVSRLGVTAARKLLNIANDVVFRQNYGGFSLDSPPSSPPALSWIPPTTASTIIHGSTSVPSTTLPTDSTIPSSNTATQHSLPTGTVTLDSLPVSSTNNNTTASTSTLHPLHFINVKQTLPVGLRTLAYSYVERTAFGRISEPKPNEETPLCKALCEFVDGAIHAIALRERMAVADRISLERQRDLVNRARGNKPLVGEENEVAIPINGRYRTAGTESRSERTIEHGELSSCGYEPRFTPIYRKAAELACTAVREFCHQCIDQGQRMSTTNTGDESTTDPDSYIHVREALERGLLTAAKYIHTETNQILNSTKASMTDGWNEGSANRTLIPPTLEQCKQLWDTQGRINYRTVQPRENTSNVSDKSVLTPSTGGSISSSPTLFSSSPSATPSEVNAHTYSYSLTAGVNVLLWAASSVFGPERIADRSALFSEGGYRMDKGTAEIISSYGPALLALPYGSLLASRELSEDAYITRLAAARMITGIAPKVPWDNRSSPHTSRPWIQALRDTPSRPQFVRRLIALAEATTEVYLSSAPGSLLVLTDLVRHVTAYIEGGDPKLHEIGHRGLSYGWEAAGGISASLFDLLHNRMSLGDSASGLISKILLTILAHPDIACPDYNVRHDPTHNDPYFGPNVVTKEREYSNTQKLIAVSNGSPIPSPLDSEHEQHYGQLADIWKSLGSGESTLNYRSLETLVHEIWLRQIVTRWDDNEGYFVPDTVITPSGKTTDDTERTVVIDRCRNVEIEEKKSDDAEDTTIPITHTIPLPTVVKSITETDYSSKYQSPILSGTVSPIGNTTSNENPTAVSKEENALIPGHRRRLLVDASYLAELRSGPRIGLVVSFGLSPNDCI